MDPKKGLEIKRSYSSKHSIILVSALAFCIVFTYICILSDILPYLILAQIVFSGALHRHSLT